ncbi:hypothetical protein BESB_022570 [Besnoitia besnoiti]|uniref:Uncharacterized protein n=1 Tax=Besnoitia besnoiti TaxID=94643 RepID=A0A2A9M1A4_BESBE|nr:hypothetical protein BESB_022570 [Besnoitia besnoiti]PFH31765.1 hypothetical protein BESB_022570 [Besnoitia besnoiti]
MGSAGRRRRRQAQAAAARRAYTVHTEFADGRASCSAASDAALCSPHRGDAPSSAESRTRESHDASQTKPQGVEAKPPAYSVTREQVFQLSREPHEALAFCSPGNWMLSCTSSLALPSAAGEPLPGGDERRAPPAGGGGGEGGETSLPCCLEFAEVMPTHGASDSVVPEAQRATPAASAVETLRRVEPARAACSHETEAPDEAGDGLGDGTEPHGYATQGSLELQGQNGKTGGVEEEAHRRQTQSETERVPRGSERCQPLPRSFRKKASQSERSQSGKAGEVAWRPVRSQRPPHAGMPASELEQSTICSAARNGLSAAASLSLPRETEAAACHTTDTRGLSCCRASADGHAAEGMSADSARHARDRQLPALSSSISSTGPRDLSNCSQRRGAVAPDAAAPADEPVQGPRTSREASDGGAENIGSRGCGMSACRGGVRARERARDLGDLVAASPGSPHRRIPSKKCRNHVLIPAIGVEPGRASSEKLPSAQALNKQARCSASV